MGGVKPDLDPTAVTSLMAETFGAPITGLAPVEGGNVARTFSFAVDDREYIVRFNERMGANFEKEAFVAGRYASPAVPIPRIVRLGEFGGLRYAVSEKAPGVTLDALPAAEAVSLVPGLLDALDAIHAADVRATTGYGVIGDDGNGLSPSWPAHLRSVYEPAPDWDFYGGWEQLFDTTFLDRGAYDRLFERMEALLPSCPDERFLVHGNPGFGNVLVNDRRITAVLDWLNAAYGDFLFDVAWLDVWGTTVDYAAASRRRYAERGVDVPGFDERLRCYQAFIGMDASRFFAKAGNEDAYRWTQDRASKLVLGEG